VKQEKDEQITRKPMTTVMIAVGVAANPLKRIWMIVRKIPWLDKHIMDLQRM
jgi:uncharacterized membrane protein